MQIGNYVFPYGLVLAPMAGVTDSAFRQICKFFGAELVVSEMISAKGMHFSDKKTIALAAHTCVEKPITIQLFGSDPFIMAEAAQSLCSMPNPPQIIDINMGCPMKKIVSNGDGCALMRTPELAAEIVKRMVNAVSVPITVKFRTGWDASSINAPEFAKRMEDAGVSAITIHGRTKEQLYAPPIDMQTIERVCGAVSIPVIGNGGIETADDAIRMYDLGCAGIALAQGVCGKPWLFAEIISKIKKEPFSIYSKTQRLQIIKNHLELAVQEKGEGTAIREMRWHLSRYLHGMTGAAHARDAINHANTKMEVVGILEMVFAEK